MISISHRRCHWKPVQINYQLPPRNALTRLGKGADQALTERALYGISTIVQRCDEHGWVEAVIVTGDARVPAVQSPVEVPPGWSQDVGLDRLLDLASPPDTSWLSFEPNSDYPFQRRTRHRR